MTYEEKVEELYQSYLRSFDTSLGNIQREVTKLLSNYTTLTPTDAISIQTEIDRIYEDEYTPVINDTVNSFNTAWLLLLTLPSLKGTKIDKRVLNKVRKNAVTQFQSQATLIKSKLNAAIYNASIVGSRIANIIVTSNDIIKSNIGNPKATIIDTFYKSTATIVTYISGKADIKKWKYVGPSDDKTRSWCSNHLGNEYTKSELMSEWQSSWSGKSGSDPFLDRGGYNCRHHLEPVE
jgi:hypothetical protein